MAGNAARHDDPHAHHHGAHRTCASIQIVRSRVTFGQPFPNLFSPAALHAPALDLHAFEHYVGDEHAFSDPIHLVQLMKIHR